MAAWSRKPRLTMMRAMIGWMSKAAAISSSAAVSLRTNCQVLSVSGDGSDVISARPQRVCC
jgi:hypothetical protein